MLHTSEQFANKQFKERHESVAQAATSRQTDRRERQAARISTDDEYLREASRLANTTKEED